MGIQRCTTGMLGSLAESMLSLRRGADSDIEVTLPQLVDGALRSLPMADYAGITVVHRPDSLETACASAPHVQALDEITDRCGDGPVLAAAWEQPVVRVADLAADDRWPQYRRACLDGTPPRSLMCLRMFAHHRSAGVLSLYSDTADAFDEEAGEVATIYAGYAALAWRLLCRDEQFRKALASRDVIGQAKGMIMVEYKVDAVQAFEMLRKLSQDTNTPVVTLAEQVVESRLQ